MIVVLTACTQTVRFPPDLFPDADTGLVLDTADPRPPAISSTIVDTTLTAGCNAAGTAINASFMTNGWAGGAEAALISSLNNNIEVHPYLLEDSDVAGQWDRYTLGPLLDGASMPDPGRATSFRCGQDDSTISWAVWTTHRSGTPADCVVWGPDPAQAQATYRQLHPTSPATCRTVSVQ